MKRYLVNFFNKVIRRFGKDNYNIDKSLSIGDLFIIVILRLASLCRGLLIAVLIKKSTFPLFVSRGAIIYHKHKLLVGKNVFIGEGVIINALCKEGVQIGSNVSIHRNTIIDCTGVVTQLGERLVIGNNVGISPNCFIQVRGEVEIQDDVIIGPGSSIFSENHIYTNKLLPIRLQGVVRDKVLIQKGAWLGANCIILSGVTIGKNAVVAAGSVVTKNVNDYEIVAGIPARLVKTIF